MCSKRVKQDLPHKDPLLIMESNPEFEFSTASSIHEFESSSADELFSNGVLLPTIQIIQEKTTTSKNTRFGEPPYMKLPPRTCSLPKGGVDDKKKKDESFGSEQVVVPNVNKNFWGFNRSKSLNCDAKKSFMFSLPSLSRSNSTGSVVPNPKRTTSSSNKHPSQSSCSTLLNLYPVSKSASGKSYGGSYANGFWINPVLNVPTPCISKGSACALFGLRSLLCVGKVKKTKN